MRREFRDLISVEEARGIVGGFSVDVAPETVPLAGAEGRVLASDARAEIDVPPFPRSLMDGYAVRAGDTYGAGEASPVGLELSGSVEAGEEPSAEVDEGGCVEIATGGVLPGGADAVVMVERTDREGDDVLIRRAVAPGENVMQAGEDVREGGAVVESGTRLGPREVGGLAAIGLEEVEVLGRPSVAVFSTGNELVEPGGELRRGQVFDVNSYVIRSALRNAGCEPVFLGVSRDDEEGISGLVDEAAEHDLALSSGSTSAGAGDVVYRVVEERGDLLAHGVAMKPGRPTVLAELDGTPFVGLPGNPSSAYAVYAKLVDPFLRSATGLPVEEERVGAVMRRSAKSDAGRHELRFVSLEQRNGGLRAFAVEKVSGAVTLLMDADGYVEVPEGVSTLDEGEDVEVTVLSRRFLPNRVE
ncbi:MAG: hypothetical protein MAG715_00519 [Methanonatronarchaeales archaeon]|nr:hypothetical protein [Methanonatronarchaeales archaeon]